MATPTANNAALLKRIEASLSAIKGAKTPKDAWKAATMLSNAEAALLSAQQRDSIQQTYNTQISLIQAGVVKPEIKAPPKITPPNTIIQERPLPQTGDLAVQLAADRERKRRQNTLASNSTLVTGAQGATGNTQTALKGLYGV